MSKSVQLYSVWLDFIRGCAALAVFVGHARVLFLDSVVGRIGLKQEAVAAEPAVAAVARASVDGTTNFSHEAVIVFFVLSGYLVGGSVIRDMRADRWSVRRYAAFRMSRLWTVLIPALVLTAMLDHIGIHLYGLRSIYGAPAGQGLVFADLVANRMTLSAFLGNLSFLQITLVPTFGTDSPLWTLAYEFWFYVSFPLLACLFFPRYGLATRLCAGLGLVAIGLFVGGSISYYFCLWLLGCLVELAPLRLSEAAARRYAVAAGAAFIAACVLLLRLRLYLPLSDTLQALLFSGLLLAVTQIRSEAPPGLFRTVSTGLSDMSYTLYLCHSPLLVFVCAAVMSDWHRWPLSTAGVMRFSAVLAVVFAASYAMYYLFERNTPAVRRFVRGRIGL